MARALGVSHTTVIKALRRLAAAGEIRSECRFSVRRLHFAGGSTDWTEKQRGAILLAARHGTPRPSVASIIAAAIRRAAERLEQCPSNDRLAVLAGCSPSLVRRRLAGLLAAGTFAIEKRGMARRVTYPDGTATSWPARSSCRQLPDIVAAGAVRELRRQNLVVFDVAVVRQAVPGRTWSVDGRLLDRSAVIALAAARARQAMAAQ
jgi:DNA-binding transcriptional regulator YhcF (GntR family)